MAVRRFLDEGDLLAEAVPRRRHRGTQLLARPRHAVGHPGDSRSLLQRSVSSAKAAGGAAERRAYGGTNDTERATVALSIRVSWREPFRWNPSA
jgi:hypothetical protein